MSTCKALCRLPKEYARWDHSLGQCVLPDENNLQLWQIHFTCPPECIYAHEKHILQFQIPNNYPIEPPQVQFLTPIEHKHVYSNGVICLSILYLNAENQESGTSWTPTLTIEKIYLSILSMICNATARGRPHDDKEYIMQCARGIVKPQTTRFHFDDDTC